MSNPETLSFLDLCQVCDGWGLAPVESHTIVSGQQKGIGGQPHCEPCAGTGLRDGKKIRASNPDFPFGYGARLKAAG